MITPRELISVCRQIGGMMEAGVDILRITRVLRSQTDNARLLDLYDTIDHELTMGRGLADVLARASDVFSPFAISLVRQGEERNNLAVAFLRLADFLEKEVGLKDGAPAGAAASHQSAQFNSAAASLDGSPGAARGIQSGNAAIKVLWARSVWLLCVWMLAVAIVLLASESGWLDTRLRAPISLLLCAAIGSIANWHWNRVAGLSAAYSESASDFPAQVEGEFFGELQSATPQSTLGVGWDNVANSHHFDDDEEFADAGQSTSRDIDTREFASREESDKDGTETDASDLLGRFKQRVPRRDAPEEEFE